VTRQISVCIPTCDRPNLLEEALQSVLRQEPSPYEVLVGDDSSNDRTGQVVEKYQDGEENIRYLRNEPPHGQARNVDRLFREAQGDSIVLLHDDDLLLEGALRALSDCFEQNEEVVAAFGKQQVADTTGTVDEDTTQTLNEVYHRTRDNAGRQSSSLRSAVTQQFPNDGYMVDAEAARRVGYNRPHVGDACDFAFGVELARASDRDFYFVDTYTAQYRESEESVARGEGASDAAYNAFKIVIEDLPKEVRSDPYVEDWLERRAPVAIMMAAQNNDPMRGLKWFLSPYHQMRIASLGGVRRLLALITSPL